MTLISDLLHINQRLTWLCTKNHHTALGPMYKMSGFSRTFYNADMLEKTKRVVNQDDFKFDKCTADQTYDSTKHICTDPENPLFYLQTEFLIDVLNGDVQEEPDDYKEYYPSLEETPFTCLYTKEINNLHFNIVEWTSDTQSFWTGWVRREMMANLNSKFIFTGLRKRRRDESSDNTKIKWKSNGEGANTFAQNLIWWNHRHEKNRLKENEKFFIAFVSNTDKTLTTQNIFMAVGVFVHEKSLYSTMGITKSFRLSMYDTEETYEYMQSSGLDESQRNQQTAVLHHANQHLNRGSIKLQSFIADFIQEKHSTVCGLFFRPNKIMRNFVCKYFPDYDLGSDKDIRNAKEPRVARVQSDIQMDDPPRIIQLKSDEEIQIRGETFPVPFWEPPSQNAHPDYWLNRHIPLMYVPVAQMRTPVSEDESKYTHVLRERFQRDGEWRTKLLRKLKDLTPSKKYWTLFCVSDLVRQDNMIQQSQGLIKDVLGIKPENEVHGSKGPAKYTFTYNTNKYHLNITNKECKIK